MTDEQALIDLVAAHREAVLATVKRDGNPQLSNVLYVWDADARVARVTTTADRLKARILQRDPRAALHVAGPSHWAYAVVEGDAEVSDEARTPGDDVCRELLPVYTTLMGPQDEQALYERLVAERRVVVRLRATRVYGLVVERSPSA
jgi:PPOX class probable F420-dependent enzyme